MASEKLVMQAKHSLAQHCRSRPRRSSTGDDEIWAREFAQLLEDYDSAVGGNNKRDVQVKSWVDDVENDLKPLSDPSWVLWGSPVLREMSNQSFGVTPQDPALVSDPGARDDERWEDMNRYMGVPNWDYLVDTIHRVERSTTGEILVYFTSRHGEKIREKGGLCKARLPKKLLAFYEENLRWDNNVVNGH
ncbi:hypothetical protein AX14_004872 [Amanita brunnescens Koide BX004]|nr:hypothetical protein AX14_004872 [Amanita brunnescens Koide BX004]